MSQNQLLIKNNIKNQDIKAYEQGMIEGDKLRKKKDLDLIDGMPQYIYKKDLMKEMEEL